MAGRKRKLRNIRTISQDYLKEQLNLIQGKQGLRNKALICFIYLSGCRISEVVPDKRAGTTGVVFDQIQPDSKDDTYVEFRELLILKLRDENKGLRRTVAINRFKDQFYLDIILNYLNEQKILGRKGNDVIWGFSRQRGLQIIKQYFPEYFCHYFRSLRARFLVTEYDFNSYRLQQYFGWSSVKSTTEYVKLSTKDIKY